MRSFTLDTNCIIAVDERRPEAAAVRALAEAHADRTADVAVVAISASERQVGGRYIANFVEFRERMAALEIAHLGMIPPLAYWDITFWDYSVWSAPPMLELEQRIHEALFPNVEFVWQSYCLANDINPESSPAGKWRNCKCDVLALWCHIHGNRDVFVTSDQNFHAASKKPTLINLGARRIEYPNDAAALLPGI